MYFLRPLKKVFSLFHIDWKKIEILFNCRVLFKSIKRLYQNKYQNNE